MFPLTHHVQEEAICAQMPKVKPNIDPSLTGNKPIQRDRSFFA